HLLRLYRLLRPISIVVTCSPPPIPPLFPYTTLFRSRATLLRRQERCVPQARHAFRQRSHIEEHEGVFVALEPGMVQGIFPELVRSEEHTSELQSHLNLVCRLLLEKKKLHQHISPSKS